MGRLGRPLIADCDLPVGSVRSAMLKYNCSFEYHLNNCSICFRNEGRAKQESVFYETMW